MEVRFIRDYCAQSNVNGACIWSEIEVIRKGENIALGVLPTSSAPLIGGTAPITNGVLNPAEYVFTNTYFEPQYVEIDLGQIYTDIEKIIVWHYYEDGRMFYYTKTQVSADGINWTTLFDSDISGTYAETPEGLSIVLMEPTQPQFNVKIGALNIDNIFLGEQQITSLYLGANLLGG
jgi:hypothetical protein